jgi:hypothetical protein
MTSGHLSPARKDEVMTDDGHYATGIRLLQIIFGTVHVTMKIFSAGGILKFVLAFLHLVTIFSGLVIMGWMMNGFNVPALVCAVTLAVCCYLIWVGSGGIALASVWVVGLMSLAAINQLWLHDLPRPRFIYIPMMLLADWMLALVIVWRLGKISDYFQQAGRFRAIAFLGLTCLVSAGLRIGWHIYPETFLYLIPVLQ